jgi:UDP-3-O-[3-hydroxymyristoyl] glucosamine N-acyltransferase
MPTIAQIADALDATLEGNGEGEITGVAGLQDASGGDISFLSNPKYASLVGSTQAAAVIVSADWRGTAPCALLRVKNADAAFARVAPLLGPSPIPAVPGIHPTAIVADTAQLGQDISIGPYCVVEPDARVGDGTILVAFCYVGHEVTIGDHCKLFPNVSIRERTRLGNRVTIHNGAVIGSDGFGYVREGAEWKKIPQIGIVEVADDVEIGANVTVDRARFGKTVIEKGAKIDNLCQIAHNCHIGENAAMAAQAGISGSTTIGRNVMLGGQAGVAGHITVGDGAIVGGQGGVTKDVPAGTFVSGYPAMPHRKATKMHAHVMRLPELKARVRELERQIEELKQGQTRAPGDAGPGPAA